MIVNPATITFELEVCIDSPAERLEYLTGMS